jgi:hypothetical protein
MGRHSHIQIGDTVRYVKNVIESDCKTPDSKIGYEFIVARIKKGTRGKPRIYYDHEDTPFVIEELRCIHKKEE